MRSARSQRSASKILARNGFKGSDVDVFIPHQANKRTHHGYRRPTQHAAESVIINIDFRYGNTTAATIPLAMEQLAQEGS